MVAEGLSTTAELIEAFRAGRPVILVDDEHRENEGDIIIAAEHVTAENIAFTIRHTGGVICLAMTNELADHLELPPMVQHNAAKRGTAYTVSIEAAQGIDTGISAKDRALTIRTTVKPDVTAADLVRPGHVFPLRARDGGVLRRAGHTEAGVDLARLAGCKPVAAVSELMHDDGTMMRLPALMAFAKTHDIPIGTIADLIAYRLAHDRFVHHVASAQLPTAEGLFELHGFRDDLANTEHVALTMGTIDDGAPVLVRMHSGVLVYLRQEGRGIGLLNKIRAYALQDQGVDTVEANLRLSFAADLRDYGVGAQMLHHLGVRRLKLLTNNPRKIVGLSGFDMEVVERVPLHAGKNPHNERYLATKVAKLGHLAEG